MNYEMIFTVALAAAIIVIVLVLVAVIVFKSLLTRTWSYAKRYGKQVCL